MVDPGCKFPSLTISQPRPVSQPSQPPEDQHYQDCRHRHDPGHHKNPIMIVTMKKHLRFWQCVTSQWRDSLEFECDPTDGGGWDGWRKILVRMTGAFKGLWSKKQLNMATKDMTQKMNMSGKKRWGESEMNGLEELTELEGGGGWWRKKWVEGGGVVGKEKGCIKGKSGWMKGDETLKLCQRFCATEFKILEHLQWIVKENLGYKQSKSDW